MNRYAHAEWWRPETEPGENFRPERTIRAPAVPAVSGAPFWALMTFTFIQILAPQQLFGFLAPLRIGLIAASVATATFLLDRIARRGPLSLQGREISVAAGLALWSAVTVPWSYWPGGSFSFLTAVYLKTLIIFWLLANVVTTLERLKTMVWGLSLMTLPLACLAIRAYLSGEFVVTGTVRRIESYEAPLTHNPNDLALLLNLVLPLTVALFLAHRRIVIRAVLVATLVLDVLAIIFSYSRAGFLTLGATASIYFCRLLRRPERGWAIAALALAFLCSPLLPAAYLERLSTISNIDADPTGSAQARWGDTIAAVTFVAHHPVIGAGLGMDFLALNEVRGPAWKDVHNVYLQHAVDLGLPGLILFLVLFAGCVRAASLVRRRTRGVTGQDDLYWLAEGIQVSLAAFAFAALFHPVAYHVYFYYIAGLALALKHVHDRLRPDVPQ